MVTFSIHMAVDRSCCFYRVNARPVSYSRGAVLSIGVFDRELVQFERRQFCRNNHLVILIFMLSYPVGGYFNAAEFYKVEVISSPGYGTDTATIDVSRNVRLSQKYAINEASTAAELHTGWEVVNLLVFGELERV